MLQSVIAGRSPASRLATFVLASIAWIPLSGSTLWAQDDPAAANLHTIGNSAYESRDYPVAIEQWSRLLSEYPDYSARLDIKYMIGQAWFKQANYAESAKTFRELR